MAAQAEVSLVLRHLHGLATEAEALSDRQLLERFVETREEEAFAALVRRHGGMVLGLCRRLLGHQQDAEDCFQAAFFILARKAASIRRQVSLGAWLYSVAYRLALKARAASARRRDKESQGAAVPPVDPTTDVTSRDLRLLLDEELQQLPDGYRAALVLCYLEDRTQEQAARQLGWSKGTLRRRLIQGRELLRCRLLRRGVAPAVALAATLTATHAASAASVELAASTVRAALGFGVGKAAAAPSTRAAALAERGLNSMFVNRLKTLTALLLAVSVAAAGLWTCRAGAPADKVANKSQPTPSRKPATDAKQETADTIEVSGRVLDPTGKPFAGARVYCFRNSLQHIGDGGIVPGTPHGQSAATASGPDGRFRLRIKKANHRTAWAGQAAFEATVAAIGKGYGPGWEWVGRPEQLKGLTLKLVRDDVPIRGRVLDLEGKPIKGMTVRLLGIIANRREDLQPWVDFLKQGKDATRFWGFLDKSLAPAVVGLTHTTTTDAAGRFRLSGAGRERVLALRFEGPNCEAQVEYAMTRVGPATRILRGREQPTGAETMVLRGAVFERVAAPSRLVTGTVRDRDTGKPLAGVSIVGMAHRSGMHTIRTTTDREGRYRILGLPRAGTHRILAVPPDGQPYLPSSAETGQRPGFDPIRLDFGLKRGILIRGKVTDRVTGKPVVARVHYFAFNDNPNLSDFPGFNGSSDRSPLTRPDGSFTLAGLPGRGLIAAAAVHGAASRYLAGAGAERIKGLRNGSFATAPYHCSAGLFNTLVEIRPEANVSKVLCNVVLDPGMTVKGSIVGPDGRPLKGARIEGLGGLFNALRIGPLPEATFAIPHINPSSPRPFFFYHDGKKLGAVSTLKGGEAKDVVVQLRPLATVTGRLLDSEGRPVSGASLAGFVEAGQLNLRTPWGGLFSASLDKQGRFRIVVLPGVRMGAELVKGAFAVSRPLRQVLLRPGEVKDLGDITIKTGP